MTSNKGALLALAMLSLSGGAAAGERAAAEVACTATERRLVYDCNLVLTGKNSGMPLEGATVVVKAEMPSMPMAHNVPPVTAMPMGTAGHYRARIDLEMPGAWTLTIDVSGPTRDRLVKTVQLGEGGEQAMERETTE